MNRSKKAIFPKHHDDIVRFILRSACNVYSIPKISVSGVQLIPPISEISFKVPKNYFCLNKFSPWYHFVMFCICCLETFKVIYFLSGYRYYSSGCGSPCGKFILILYYFSSIPVKFRMIIDVFRNIRVWKSGNISWISPLSLAVN